MAGISRPTERTVMRKRTAKLFLLLSVVSALSALPAVAQARGGDDANNDVSHVDGPGHH